jgi:phosphoribosylformylglycinamidine synthase
VRDADVAAVLGALFDAGLGGCAREIGRVTTDDRIHIVREGATLLTSSRTELRAAWSETTWRMQALRDHPDCAREEYERMTDAADTGLFAELSFDPADDVAAPYVSRSASPQIAILREQGVNSQLEMAAAFARAGFTPFDVHMTDLLAGRMDLAQFTGLVACGGFSYGDVLGAGEGWAKSILFHPELHEQFSRFFSRQDTFTLGVCNGCQMLSALKDLIPGAAHWPRFVRNRSEQFEGRAGLVRIDPSPSLLFDGMAGSVIPIAVAHGEGRAEFADATELDRCRASSMVCMTFVDHAGEPAERYQSNPNGSPHGITGLTSVDGRATILMPHPERVFRSVLHSWRPDDWPEDSPWMRLFRNARKWIG